MTALRLACTLAAPLFAVSPLAAQICQGTPRNGGIAFEHGLVNFGNTNGVSGTVAGKHLALGGAYRHVEVGQDMSGNDAEGRFAIVLGGSRIQVCPGFGAEYETLAWKIPSAGTLNTRELVGRAGIGIGFEQPVYRGVSLIPFGMVQYAYSLIDYKLDAPNTNSQEVGDSTSRGDAEYGLLAHYKIVYGGYTARHALKSAPPYFARWIVGLSFSTGSGGNKSPDRTRTAAATSSRAAVKAEER